MNIHKSVTIERVQALCMRQLHSLDDPGICIACGNEADGVEPDARNYTCEHCGQPYVFGAEQALIERLYHGDE